MLFNFLATVVLFWDMQMFIYIVPKGISCSIYNVKSGHWLCYRFRKNISPSRGHGQVEEALLSEGGERPRVERASSQKPDKLESGNILFGDEVNEWKEVMSGFPAT